MSGDGESSSEKSEEEEGRETLLADVASGDREEGGSADGYCVEGARLSRHPTLTRSAAGAKRPSEVVPGTTPLREARDRVVERSMGSLSNPTSSSVLTPHPVTALRTVKRALRLGSEKSLSLIHI